ncbi:MAG: hypothetical protein JXQ26_06260 [Tissierellales bacterium]|nr:hypothetical protein [Tissierellales bacterium]
MRGKRTRFSPVPDALFGFFLAQNHNNLQKRMQDLLREIDKKKAKRNLMKVFLKTLRKQDKLLTEFDEKLWSFTSKTGESFNGE